MGLLGPPRVLASPFRYPTPSAPLIPQLYPGREPVDFTEAKLLVLRARVGLVGRPSHSHLCSSILLYSAEICLQSIEPQDPKVTPACRGGLEVVLMEQVEPHGSCLSVRL